MLRLMFEFNLYFKKIAGETNTEVGIAGKKTIETVKAVSTRFKISRIQSWEFDCIYCNDIIAWSISQTLIGRTNHGSVGAIHRRNTKEERN